jgi:hypothetical protein
MLLIFLFLNKKRGGQVRVHIPSFSHLKGIVQQKLRYVENNTNQLVGIASVLRLWALFCVFTVASSSIWCNLFSLSTTKKKPELYEKVKGYNWFEACLSSWRRLSPVSYARFTELSSRGMQT